MPCFRCREDCYPKERLLIQPIKLYLITAIASKYFFCVLRLSQKGMVIKMKAMLIKDGGRLEWSDVATPVIKPDEVLVKVKFAAVNRADLMQREGLYPFLCAIPTVLCKKHCIKPYFLRIFE